MKALPEEQRQQDTTATVVVGTYDGGLLGFGLEDGAQRFGYAPHVGCVKALHCTQDGKLATGATDNAVRLFDLAKGVEMGELQEHEDSVAAVQFWGPSLITGSSDGQVCIWRCSDYELLLKFRGHKASVTCLAVHPSGRMMASAGRDQRIQLWDLTRGTSAAHLSVLEAVEALEWSPDGQSIAALSPRDLVAVEVASNSVASFKDPASAGFMRVSFTAVAWLSSKVLALGDGRGQVQIFEKEGEALTEVCKVPRDGNVTGRIKALIKVNARLMVGLSTGLVEVWSLGDLKAGSFTLLRVVDTKSRLTCMTVWAPGQGSQVLEDKHPKGKRTSGGEKPVKKEQVKQSGKPGKKKPHVLKPIPANRSEFGKERVLPGNTGADTEIIIDDYGLHFLVQPGGTLAHFSFNQFLEEVTTSLALLAASGIVVKFLAVYLFPLGGVYDEAMTKTSPDIHRVEKLMQMSQEELQQQHQSIFPHRRCDTSEKLVLRLSHIQATSSDSESN